MEVLTQYVVVVVVAVCLPIEVLDAIKGNKEKK